MGLTVSPQMCKKTNFDQQEEYHGCVKCNTFRKTVNKNYLKHKLLIISCAINCAFMHSEVAP